MGEKKKDPEKERIIKLRHRYGITINDYNRMFHEQGGKCFICKAKKYDSTGRNLAVDHDHKTGRVRGLLCYRCNILIGHYSEEVMLEAIRYMKERF